MREFLPLPEKSFKENQLFSKFYFMALTRMLETRNNNFEVKLHKIIFPLFLNILIQHQPT